MTVNGFIYFFLFLWFLVKTEWADFEFSTEDNVEKCRIVVKLVRVRQKDLVTLIYYFTLRVDVLNFYVED